ncbi:hypothetical protein D3C81_870600 [compost metagenome]
MVLGAGQGLVGELEQRLRCITRAVGRKADAGHREDITGAGFVQALQCCFQGLGKMYRLLMHHARCQHGELATAAAGNQVFGFREAGTGAAQLLTHGLQQLVGTLAAKAGVQPRQPLDPQQQQVAGTRFFQVADPGVQLHLEITPVGQPGQAVLVRLGT